MKSEKKAVNLSNIQQKSKRYNLEAEKNIRASDWLGLVNKILKVQDAKEQFYLIRQLFNTLKLLNEKTFINFVEIYINAQVLSSVKSISTFFFLIKFKLYSEFVSLLYSSEKIFNSFTKIQPPYQKQILNLQNQDIQKYPSLFIDQIEQAFDIFPYFVQRLSIRFTSSILDYILNWILVYPTKTNEQIYKLNDFCIFIFRNCSRQQLIGTEVGAQNISILLLKIFRKCLLNYEGSSNYFLLIDKLSDFSIQSAIVSNEKKFLDFNADQLIKIFFKLTDASVTAQTLKLIICISSSLKNQSNYFALKKIFQQFIQQRIIKHCKYTTQTQTEVNNLVSLYIQGFLNKIKYNRKNIELLLQNFVLIPNQYQKFWFKMACIESYKSEQLKNVIQSQCNNIKHEQLLSQEEYEKLEKTSWIFNQRDLSQKKKYKLQNSRLSGIQNTNSYCYIISVMQGLYMSKSFADLLHEYSRYYFDYLGSFSRYITIKHKLLYALQQLFKDLKAQQKHIKINEVKKAGPHQFVVSQQQQDCHHYLTKLFEEIQKQFDALPQKIKNEMKNKFKLIFELSLMNVRYCTNCHEKYQNIQHSYIHSIDYTQLINQQWLNQINFKCQKCSQNIQTSQKCKFIKLPQILLVHLKRFDFKDGKGIKKLGQSIFKRKFQSHLLVGFIVHIGATIVAGHYILYFRKQQNLKKWYKFSDNDVTEFKIQNEDESFELNFKSQQTVYIAIYKRKLDLKN